ncbi:MAG: DUF167 domain-containing protein [Nanoarchaeota archaeon]
MEIKLPIKIIVKTNSKKTQILGYDKERKAYKVEVKAPPEKNKANTEIEKYFSKLLKQKVKIISGKTSKTKLLK